MPPMKNKIVFILLLAFASVAGAQEAEPVEPQPLPEEKSAELRSLYDASGERREAISKLEQWLVANDGKA